MKVVGNKAFPLTNLLTLWHYDLFTLEINNGLRISDILQLKVEDLKRLKVGQTVKLREQKTGTKS